jgi:methyl-accepting chemotaxis protein
MIQKKAGYLIIIFFLILSHVQASPEIDKEIEKITNQTKLEVEEYFTKAVKTGRLTLGEIFSTFYIPIPNTNPPKFHTVYDMRIEGDLQIILDNNLSKNSKLLYVVAMDRKGYAPTHNSKYCVPPGRDKRLYNDGIGIKAANANEPLLQEYNRDDGVKVYDYSVPININGKKWGVIRVGFK